MPKRFQVLSVSFFAKKNNSFRKVKNFLMKMNIYQDHLNDLFSSEYKKAKEESNYQANFSKYIKFLLLMIWEV